MNKLFLLLLISSVGLISQAATSASSFKVKIYKVAVSTSADCSGLTTIYDEANPTETDLGNSGNLMDVANVPAGTYNCVVWEVSDHVKITPTADSGTACSASVETSVVDICGFGSDRFPASAATVNPHRLIGSGSNTACSSTTEDRKPLYFSTQALYKSGAEAFAAGKNSWQPSAPPSPATGTDASAGNWARGIRLDSPIVVSGEKRGILTFDTRNGVDTTDHDYSDLGGIGGDTAKVCAPTSISFSLE